MGFRGQGSRCAFLKNIPVLWDVENETTKASTGPDIPKEYLRVDVKCSLQKFKCYREEGTLLP